MFKKSTHACMYAPLVRPGQGNMHAKGHAVTWSSYITETRMGERSFHLSQDAARAAQHIFLGPARSFRSWGSGGSSGSNHPKRVEEGSLCAQKPTKYPVHRLVQNTVNNYSQDMESRLRGEAETLARVPAWTLTRAARPTSHTAERRGTYFVYAPPKDCSSQSERCADDGAV